jgi:hypothetical protein
MVPRDGLEPPARGASTRRSTAELPWRIGRPGRTRTCDVRGKGPPLWPLSYRSIGSDGRLRTCNLLGNSEALCRLSYIGNVWGRRRESNSRPSRYEGAALPSELRRRKVVAAAGIEPAPEPYRDPALPLSYAACEFGAAGRSRTCNCAQNAAASEAAVSSSSTTAAVIGGEGGIRTHGTSRSSCFRDKRLKPLGHLSVSGPPSLELRRAAFAMAALACQPKPFGEGWSAQTESNRRGPDVGRPLCH